MWHAYNIVHSYGELRDEQLGPDGPCLTMDMMGWSIMGEVPLYKGFVRAPLVYLAAPLVNMAEGPPRRLTSLRLHS